jgi:hypothetical protein
VKGLLPGRWITWLPVCEIGWLRDSMMLGLTFGGLSAMLPQFSLNDPIA